MRKDAGTYGDAQRIEQLGWMFFFKIFDDREKEMELLASTTSRRSRSTCAGPPGPPGRGRASPATPARLRQQHAPAQAQGPRPADAGQDPRRASSAWRFEDANNYMKNGTLMRQVINKINGHRLQRLR
jgi:type I restriction enzyme M protein